MAHTARISITIVMILSVLSIDADPHRSSANTEPSLELIGGTPDQHAILEWAMDRFDLAGMELPNLTVTFEVDRSKCDGFVGLTHRVGDRFELATCAGGGELRHNLLHELAHAWDFAGGVGDRTREGLVAMRGLHTWGGRDLAWQERGMEHAAEVIAWGLDFAGWEIPTPVSEVGPQEPEALRSAFILLTGRPPLWETESG